MSASQILYPPSGHISYLTNHLKSLIKQIMYHTFHIFKQFQPTTHTHHHTHHTHYRHYIRQKEKMRKSFALTRPKNQRVRVSQGPSLLRGNMNLYLEEIQSPLLLSHRQNPVNLQFLKFQAGAPLR